MDSIGLAISAVTVLVMEVIVLVSTRNGGGRGWGVGGDNQVFVNVLLNVFENFLI